VRALTGDSACGSNPARVSGGYQDRCGYGPRQPLLVVSPYARANTVDHTVTDQSSILRFIEDNWSTGRVGNSSFDELAGPLTGMLDLTKPDTKPLFLDPSTGTPVSRGDAKQD
jgi:phospholipase C